MPRRKATDDNAWDPSYVDEADDDADVVADEPVAAAADEPVKPKAKSAKSAAKAEGPPTPSPTQAEADAIRAARFGGTVETRDASATGESAEYKTR